MGDTRRATTAPGRLPLVGHLPSLARRPLEFLNSLQARDGITHFQLGSLPVYFVSDPDLVHDILVTKARHFGRGATFERVRPVFGNGIATSDGRLHRTRRRLIQPAFHRARIDGYIEIMRRNATKFTQEWRDGQVIDVPVVMQQFTLTVIAQAAFSAEAAWHAVAKIQQYVPLIIKGFLPRTIVPKALSWLPIPAIKRFDEASRQIRTEIQEVITAYRRVNADHPDLLSLLLATDTMTDKQISDEVVTMFIAGTETAGTTLSWACYELARHPEIEKRLLAEIRTVIGEGEINPGHIPQLAYTRRVLTEALRMYSPLLFMRRVLAPVELGGVSIPEQAEVAYSAFAMHRDPTLFPEPDTFDPDRWLPEREAELPRYGFIPFADGAHKCIGDHFAWAEMIIALATMLRRWQLRPLAGQQVKLVPAQMPRASRLLMTATARQ